MIGDSSLRTRLLLAAAFAVALAAGCSSERGYPADLKYRLRADVLVKEKGKDRPRQLDTPGKLEEAIRKGAESVIDPAVVLADAAVRKNLAASLEGVFGTPAKPTVNTEGIKGPAAGQAESLLLGDRQLRRGSEHYRRHCMHCHGVAGDGRGPTGPWIHPHPRDYRQGLFKFVSTNTPTETNKPKRSDLLRTLVKGIESSTMPAFNTLPDRDLESMVSYVIHLAIRGEAEFNVIKDLADKLKPGADGKVPTVTAEEIDKSVKEQVAGLLAQWADVDGATPFTPPAYPYKEGDKGELAASISRGHKLFIGDGICITCHYDYGRQSSYLYDSWGTLVRPNNLTAGTYRGGRRPLDIFHRVYGGIAGSGMPGYKAKGSPEDQAKAYWDLVNFVQNVPYPGMLPDEVRRAVYPTLVVPRDKSAVASAEPNR